MTGPSSESVGGYVYVFRTAPVNPAINNVASDHAASWRHQPMIVIVLPVTVSVAAQMPPALVLTTEMAKLRPTPPRSTHEHPDPTRRGCVGVCETAVCTDKEIQNDRPTT